MSSKYQNGMALILKRLRGLLRGYSPRRGLEGEAAANEAAELRAQLTLLTSSQEIANRMLPAKDHRLRLTALLYRHLAHTLTPEQIWAENNRLRRGSGERYNLATHTIPTLIKDVVENSRLIEEELRALTANVEALPSVEREAEAPAGLALCALLKMAMDSSTELEEEANELLFRAYILEESIALLVLKALRVLSELQANAEDRAESQKGSVSEKSGKRSALSESIEVFKRNNQRQEMERIELTSAESPPREIQTDYKMARKTERPICKAELRLHCCF